MSIVSKERREIYSRKISSFWKDFSHNKIGLVGLAIIGFYVFLAVSAPYLSPYPPVNMPRISSGFAMPNWVTMFPQYSDLPPTIPLPLNWTPLQSYSGIGMEYGAGPNITYNRALAVNDTIGEFKTYRFQVVFDYLYGTPREFEAAMVWTASFNNLTYRIALNVTNPTGDTFPILGEEYSLNTSRVEVPDFYWDMSMGNWLTTSGGTAIVQRMNFERLYREAYQKYFDDYIQQHTNYTEFYDSTYVGARSSQEFLWNITYAYNNLPQYTDANYGGFNSYFENYWNGNETWPGWNASVSISPYLGGSSYRRNYVLRKHYDAQKVQWNSTLGNSKALINATTDALFNQTYWAAYYNGNATWAGFKDIYLQPQWENVVATYYANASAVADFKAKDSAKAECSVLEKSPSQQIFTSKGRYILELYLVVKPTAENAELKIAFGSESRFKVWGLVHGLLGSDSYGKDVLTQVLYGAQISLIIGSLAAILATSLELVFGVTSGYLGGLVDEVTMRAVDVLLCLPTLPLLLALSAYFRPNVYFIVLIIAIFGWQGGARVIRSRVLTIREMPFVESARSSGASDSYLIFRHLIPNVFPIAIASMILAVPAAVLTEAGLSFLGFGDPLAPTWGKMLNEARDSGAFTQLAWHYILPPGLAITILCVAFVFVGHALDEIVNPRLRRRR
jgi:ABC-type dipeptide/oligopeptide/nickel transport system permease subunit